MNDWDREYSSTPTLFGNEPAPMLVEHADAIERTLPVLDVGCGQGRNTLFLARCDLDVHALDPSTVAVDQTRLAAAAEDLRISTQIGVLEDVHRPANGFGSILVFGLIPILTRAQIDEMVTSIQSLMAPGGLLFVTAFTTADPKHEIHGREWTEVGKNSFQSPKGDIRTYLEPGELIELFRDWQVVSIWEDLGPEHRHGDGPVERHGLAEAVFRLG
jgi:tellurite methyltransferase